MTWFFDDAEAQQRLFTTVAEWMDTPFREYSRAKGSGIDCAGFVEVSFIGAGLAREGDFTFARGDGDYQSHRIELRILRLLRGHATNDPQSARLAAMFEELELPNEKSNIDPDFFMPGDLLVLRRGGLMHLPIMLRDRRLAHCSRPLGVQEGNIHDPTFSGPLDAVFRARSTATIATVTARASRLPSLSREETSSTVLRADENLA